MSKKKKSPAASASNCEAAPPRPSAPPALADALTDQEQQELRLSNEYATERALSKQQSKLLGGGRPSAQRLRSGLLLFVAELDPSDRSPWDSRHALRERLQALLLELWRLDDDVSQSTSIYGRAYKLLWRIQCRGIAGKLSDHDVADLRDLADDLRGKPPEKQEIPDDVLIPIPVAAEKIGTHRTAIAKRLRKECGPDVLVKCAGQALGATLTQYLYAYRNHPQQDAYAEKLSKWAKQYGG